MAKPRRPYIKRLYHRRGVEAWLVDGSYIRKNIDEEFSNFGHHGSFDSIPTNEISHWPTKDGNEL